MVHPLLRQASTLTLNNHRTCPFAHCTQHQDADKPVGFDNTSALQRHLEDEHIHELDKLPLPFCRETNICICHQCKKPQLFSNSKFLERHVTTHHTPTRTKTNFDIITKFLYNKPTSSCQHNHWEDALNWLKSHNFEPPPFRSTLLPCIKWQLEEPLLDLLEDIIKATNELKKVPPTTKASLLSYNADIAAGQLIYLYEQLILAPTTNNKQDSLTQLIKRRIRLFRSGQLETLYAESRTVESSHPNTTSSSNKETQQKRQQQSAQKAADDDDFKKAISRLLKATPIAPNTPENIDICQKLHPPVLEYKPTFPGRTRSQVYTGPITFTPDEVIKCIRNLPKGKALGIQGDSLDMFARLVRKRVPQQNKQLPKSSIAHDLAIFFSNIANANFGKKERNHINTIYFVAFHKDVNNPKKLRPIGVPSAIRRITANLLITKNKPDFASHLLPFNYAIGVQGGISTIVHTMRLGVEKYISAPESTGSLPTRALVSLDIQNMFNAVSRHKLREIIAHEFPHLLPFTNMIYEDYHTAKFKDESNTWQQFEVYEGFTQGCPLSPLFAGIVLTHILQKINQELLERASSRLQNNQLHDDGRGGEPIIMAYVDDTNCLLPIEDVHFFLKRFEELGIPLGAVMNTDKTRIMTTTTGRSVLDAHIQHNHTIGLELKEAITTYSTKNSKMYEETNGLRILGSPVGSIAFQKAFIADYLQKLKTDASNLLDKLEDDQTIIQLYRQCTSQRLNHLFPADVHANALTSACSEYAWDSWDSNTAKEFDDINISIIKSITNKNEMPIHSVLLMNINTKMGGLGINTPRSKAIPASILATKGTLNSIYNGIFLGQQRKRFMLPTSITSLYADRENNPSTTFQIFNKYAPAIARLCTGDNTTEGISKFINDTPINKCHDIINKQTSHSMQQDLLERLPNDSKHNAEEIIDGKMGQGLLDLPRSEEENRQPNRLFRFNLLRCLRMDIWDTHEKLICPLCKQDFDTKGDHLFQCAKISRHVRKTMHNRWRDMWWNEMKTLIPYIKLTDTKIEREAYGLVRSIRKSKVQPFDTHFCTPIVSNDSYYRCRLSHIGFDMVTINSDTCPPPSKGGSDAKSKNIIASLILAEKNKFQRGKSVKASRTDRTSQITITGDQIIGDLFKDKMQLLPFAISPLGLFGPTINRFLYGIQPNSDYKTLHNIDQGKFPYAYGMAMQAYTKTPQDILHRANNIWKSKPRNYHYGGSYRSPDPITYYTQVFGRTVCHANGSAGLAAIHELYSNNHYGPITASSLEDDQISFALHNIDGDTTSQGSSSQSTTESSQPSSNFYEYNTSTT